MAHCLLVSSQNRSDSFQAGALLFAISVPFFMGQSLAWVCLAMLGTSIAFSISYGNSPGIVNRASRYDGGVTNSLYLSVYYLFSALGSLLPVMVYSEWGITSFVFLLLLICAVDMLFVLAAKHKMELY